MCTDALKLPSMLAHTTRPAAPDSSRTPTASWPFVSPLSLQPLWVSAPCSHVPSPRPSLVEPAGQGCGRWSPPPSRLSPHGRCEPQAGGRGQCCCREPRGSCLFREGDQLRSIKRLDTCQVLRTVIAPQEPDECYRHLCAVLGGPVQQAVADSGCAPEAWFFLVFSPYLPVV